MVAEDIGGSRPAINGEDVVLTLDADVQNRAIEVFGDESGACVVMDVRNGDILCMVSAPSFDPNLFVGGVPTKTYRALADYERKPLLDKTLNGTFPPGSTFKPTTALALLEAGVDPNISVFCSGAYRTGNRVQRCWGRHGTQNMHNAIKNSCDVYFYAMCNRAGVDNIRKAGLALGFEQMQPGALGSYYHDRPTPFEPFDHVCDELVGQPDVPLAIRYFGGAGMAQALGARLLDEHGHELTEATPARPAMVLGLSAVPGAGQKDARLGQPAGGVRRPGARPVQRRAARRTGTHLTRGLRSCC